MGLLKYTLVAALAAGVVTGLAAARVKPSHPVDARVVVVQPAFSSRCVGSILAVNSRALPRPR